MIVAPMMTAPMKLLSAREAEVLQALADGLDPRTVAMKLGISPNTIKTHLGNVYRKLGVQDKGQAIARAMREGWIK